MTRPPVAEYSPALGAADRTLPDIVSEWRNARQSTLALFRRLPPGAWSRRGTASDQPISVGALAYVIVGHARHHLEVVEARYLGDLEVAIA